MPRRRGLFNFRGASEMSWHGFADKLLKRGRSRSGLSAAAAAGDQERRAERAGAAAAYSVLSCAHIKRDHRRRSSGAAIESDLDRMVRAILAT